MNGFIALMYHEIMNKRVFDYAEYKGIRVRQGYQDILPRELFVDYKDFEEQMAYLHDEGYTTLKLSDVVDFYYTKKVLPKKSVLLTFDDMYQSVLFRAYPILKKYGFHAVGFVVKGWIFEENQDPLPNHSVCLSEKQLVEMKDVFEYANHTNFLHTRNTQGGAIEFISQDEFNQDILECEDFVTTNGAFAYPFGLYLDENIQWLKDLGFQLAFTSDNGRNDRYCDPFKLNRNGVFVDYTLDDFKMLLE